MIKYEDIQKANEEIKTTNIKGKEYAEVKERINAFRKVYPEGYIRTEMVSNENGVCVFKAEVGKYSDGYIPEVLGTGYAYEKESNSFMHRNSFIEICETSAAGRALGMAGFGIDTAVASADEMENAINNQSKPITAQKAKTLGKMIESCELDISDICKHYGHTELSEFTEEEYANCLKRLEATKKEMEVNHE